MTDMAQSEIARAVEDARLGVTMVQIADRDDEDTADLAKFMRSLFPGIARVLISESQRADELETLYANECAARVATNERVKELEAENKRLAVERDDWRKVAQDYTPGVFALTTPKECADYVRELRARRHDLVCQSGSHVATLTARIERLETQNLAMKTFIGSLADEFANAGFSDSAATTRMALGVVAALTPEPAPPQQATSLEDE